MLAGLAALAVPLAGAAVVPAAPAQAAEQPEERSVTVDTGDVVQEDYLGVGVDVIPQSLMAGTAAYGYTEADWQVDVERIQRLRPKVARLWFQIDWMEPEKGRYDFDSPQMRAVYRYLDAFRAAGTEIELNFGWKVGESVQDWFSIPGVSDPTISAPADLEAYGASASALLDELINRRGYDNVDYLTFYNEPNGSWDFEAPGDEMAYYADMASAVDRRLTADGLRDEVRIWGPEETGAPEWTAYLEEHAPDVFDAYSFHLYGESYEAMADAIAERQATTGGKPLNMTEFGWTSGELSTWETGYANYIARSAEEGVRSHLVWQLNGVWTRDPDGDTNGSYNLWDSNVLGEEPRSAYYAVGPLMRYIPAHSEVLATHTEADDLRSAAFRDANGDYTVLVEARAGAERRLTVDFGGTDIGRPFHRIATALADVTPEPNALLPASSGTLPAGDSFTDTVPADAYTVTVYTTAPPATQVALDEPSPYVTGGESTALSAELVDGTGDLSWSVVAGGGSVSPEGVYTAPEVTTERRVAVRAASATDPDAYAIARLTVLPAHDPERVDAPVFDLEPGQYDSAEAVFMTSGTAGAQIHYTTDGSEPTARSPRYGDGPVFLPESGNVLLRAAAFRGGLAPSGVTSRLYKVLDVQNAPDGYRFCMYADRGRCEFDGEASVAFGSDGLFRYGTFTDGVECTAEEFGGDPNPGGDNRCFSSADIPEEPPLVTLYNAGFEKPATTSAANGPMTNGWYFSARAGVQHNDSPFVPDEPAPEGERTAYLKTDSGLSSFISQEAAFPAGSYRLTFQAAIRTGFGGPQTFDVYVDDARVGSFAPPSGAYQPYETEAFTVDAGPHTIRFQATTTEGDNTAFIDQVAVAAA
ncbi:chitobiase/beta-hexosaminidase C-terminal domain-containing protein [Streptomyces hoynatensis]|uniref:GH29D-like beta-sandwich domain-containing protein n=1 Tax=Streptomyces hoynatensis TaxID=1141874 RepID=A0A3A9YU17_9ACTN|nr:chitobiase/beta-hexosaminidase C-terminal domain-containing protein [Streptomyces hoynatensis]RKN39495.1 hypothetical protein D7294_21110 [Streptomyces hoynatensis]